MVLHLDLGIARLELPSRLCLSRIGETPPLASSPTVATGSEGCGGLHQPPLPELGIDEYPAPTPIPLQRGSGRGRFPPDNTQSWFEHPQNRTTDLYTTPGAYSRSTTRREEWRQIRETAPGYPLHHRIGSRYFYCRRTERKPFRSQVSGSWRECGRVLPSPRHAPTAAALRLPCGAHRGTVRSAAGSARSYRPRA